MSISAEKKKERVYKPSSVPRHFWRVAAIYLDQPLPVGSPDISGSDLPAGRTASRSHPGRVASLLGLADGGVYPASTVTGAAVRSYRTISPLPVPAPIVRDS